MTSTALVPHNALGRHTIHRLPVVVLHVHSRCNCRCVMCDIWQAKQTQELSRAQLDALLPHFERLGVEWVVLTGGEPLLHHDLPSICEPLRQAGIRVTLLTTGLLLKRCAQSASDLFDEIIVSIDGPPAIHDQIRRVPSGFQQIVEGLQGVRTKAPKLPLRARITVQKANHQHLRETVQAAKTLPLNSVSFLATDLTSTAFNRELLWPVARQNEVGLSEEEMIALQDEIELLIAEYRSEIDSGYIAESASKLRRIAEHFRAHLGLCPPTSPICNAPWKSAVVELDGSVRPCFFQPKIGSAQQEGLSAAINSPTSLSFRSQLNIRSNPICQRCV